MRAKQLDIGTKIPADYVTQKAAILAVTGSGKSYGAGDIIEEFLKNNIPFVLLDLMGAHYGLASSYPITIIGGSQGSPLFIYNGPSYAHKIIDNNAVIFDLSEFDDSEIQTFVADLLNELFKIHTMIRQPRHIFVEEAEVVFPQTNFENSKKSLLAGNKIMKRGRAIGLGMTLISQRPQDINKKTLSQSQCTFIMHLEGIQELEVVRKMLVNVENKSELIDKILHFQKGEALLYSPSWLGRIETFKFRKRETYHAGDTPELGKEITIPELHVNKLEPVKVEEKKEDTKQIGYDLNHKAVITLILVILILSIAASML